MHSTLSPSNCIVDGLVATGQDDHQLLGQAKLLARGAIFHDLGKSKTYGMQHGEIGAKMTKEPSLEDAIRQIILKHIRGGLTGPEAKESGLPVRDCTLRTPEEKIVIYADRMGRKRMLLLRASISQMDVPVRQSYTMAVVAPDERSTASGITTVALVGVVLNLSIWFGVSALFAKTTQISLLGGTIPPPEMVSADWFGLLLAILAFVTMRYTRAGMITTLAGCAGLGFFSKLLI